MDKQKEIIFFMYSNVSWRCFKGITTEKGNQFDFFTYCSLKEEKNQ